MCVLSTMTALGTMAYSGLAYLGSAAVTAGSAAASAAASAASAVGTGISGMFAGAGAGATAAGAGSTTAAMTAGAGTTAAEVVGGAYAGGMGLAGATGASTMADAVAAGAVSQSTAAAATTAALSGSNGLLYGALGTMAASGGMQAYGSYEQGKQESAMLKEQARINNIRAGLAMEAAGREKIDLARRQKQVIGRGKTAAAANGVMLESRPESSPAMWEQDAKMELAYEGNKIDANANMEAWAYRNNAIIQRANARTARRTGNLKGTSSLISTGAQAGLTYYGATRRA